MVRYKATKKKQSKKHAKKQAKKLAKRKRPTSCESLTNNTDWLIDRDWLLPLHDVLGIDLLSELATEKRKGKEYDHSTDWIVEHHGPAISNHTGLDGFSKGLNDGQRRKNYDCLNNTVSKLRAGTYGQDKSAIIKRVAANRLAEPHTDWLLALYKSLTWAHFLMIATEKKKPGSRFYEFGASWVAKHYGTAISNHTGLEGFSTVLSDGQRRTNYERLSTAVSKVRAGTYGNDGTYGKEESDVRNRLVAAQAAATGNNAKQRKCHSTDGNIKAKARKKKPATTKKVDSISGMRLIDDWQRSAERQNELRQRQFDLLEEKAATTIQSLCRCYFARSRYFVILFYALKRSRREAATKIQSPGRCYLIRDQLNDQAFNDDDENNNDDNNNNNNDHNYDDDDDDTDNDNEGRGFVMNNDDNDGDDNNNDDADADGGISSGAMAMDIEETVATVGSTLSSSTKRVAFAESTEEQELERRRKQQQQQEEQKKKERVDPWALLDPHSMGDASYTPKPLKKGITYLLPKGVTRPPSECVTGSLTTLSQNFNKKEEQVLDEIAQNATEAMKDVFLLAKQLSGTSATIIQSNAQHRVEKLRAPRQRQPRLASATISTVTVDAMDGGALTGVQPPQNNGEGDGNEEVSNNNGGGNGDGATGRSNGSGGSRAGATGGTGRSGGGGSDGGDDGDGDGDRGGGGDDDAEKEQDKDKDKDKNNNEDEDEDDDDDKNEEEENNDDAAIDDDKDELSDNRQKSFEPTAASIKRDIDRFDSRKSQEIAQLKIDLETKDNEIVDLCATHEVQLKRKAEELNEAKNNYDQTTMEIKRLKLTNKNQETSFDQLRKEMDLMKKRHTDEINRRDEKTARLESEHTTVLNNNASEINRLNRTLAQLEGMGETFVRVAAKKGK